MKNIHLLARLFVFSILCFSLSCKRAKLTEPPDAIKKTSELPTQVNAPGKVLESPIRSQRKINLYSDELVWRIGFADSAALLLALLHALPCKLHIVYKPYHYEIENQTK